MKLKNIIPPVIVVIIVLIIGCMNREGKMKNDPKEAQGGFVAKPGKVKIFDYKTGKVN